jgi:ankyrin repeat protein
VNGLRKDTDINHELFYAAKRDDFNTVKKLLSLGANPNARIHGDDISFNWAAYHSNIPMMKLLMEHGANYKNVNIHKGNALHSAVCGEGEHLTEAINYLLELGIDPSIEDSNERNLLQSIETGEAKINLDIIFENDKIPEKAKELLKPLRIVTLFNTKG